jgi:tetratricopeptide (TPR) repeat protein
VTVNLVEPSSGKTVWSRSEEAALSAWQEITHTMYALVEFEILGTIETPRPASIDSEAFNDYLRARYQWNKRTPEALVAARDLFVRAIEREPRFAAAHAGLADAYLLLGSYGWLPPAETLPKAEASARRALDLDETLAAPHATLAYFHAQRDQWPAAQQEFERALALDPNYATARHWYALSLSFHDHGAAVAHIERARDLDPLSEIIGTDVAVVYRRVGRHDEAIAQLQRVLRVHPDFVEAAHQLSELLEMRGRYHEAAAVLERASKIAPDEPRILVGLTVAYARTNRAAEARVMYQRLRAQSAARHIPFVFLTMAAAAAGDLDASVEYAQQGVQQRELTTMRLLAFKDFPHDRLAQLKGRPKFDELVRHATAVTAPR